MGKKKIILVVEDDTDVRANIKLYLDSIGYTCWEASDGAEALELTQRKQPDLILLDIMLPRINGYQVCKKLKENEKYKNIPIIMLTAKIEREDKEWGEKMGVDAYVTKPFDLDELQKMIDKLTRFK